MDAARANGSKVAVDRASRRGARDANHFVSLGFKVPFEFRKRFKLFAVREGMSMNTVLRIAFEQLEQAKAMANLDSRNRQITK